LTTADEQSEIGGDDLHVEGKRHQLMEMLQAAELAGVFN